MLSTKFLEISHHLCGMNEDRIINAKDAAALNRSLSGFSD
jgi:hypothetical protein